MKRTHSRRFSASDAIVGGLLIAFGALLLMHQLEIINWYELGIDSIWELWPVIFIFIGIGKLADAPTLYHMGKGVWWIFIGVWLYVSINHVYGLYFKETWPALLIAWGVSMMWESFTKESKRLYKEEYYGKQ